MLHTILHTLTHTFTHTVVAIPFLFVGYLFILHMENTTNGGVANKVNNSNVLSPIMGALIGCIPQCGFCISAADLYRKNKIKVGTLLAVFISVSDEALLVMITMENGPSLMVKLILIKLVIGIIVGIVINLIVEQIYGQEKVVVDGEIKHNCGCGCESKSKSKTKNKYIEALVKSLHIFVFIFFISYIFELVLELAGTKWMESLLLNNSIVQPLLAGLIGFIPNCAASIVLVKLFGEGIITFGSMTAGLITSAGFGVLVLLEGSSNRKRAYKILLTLYIIAIVVGLFLHLV